MKKVLYTGGTFDLFHAGHANFLKQCRNLAEIVIVSLNTDEFISQYKGKSPIISYEDRKNVLLSCRYVDNVIKNFGNEDSKPAILAVNPNIIAVGDDWACKDYYKQMSFTQEWLDEMGITLAYLPYTKGISSTLIKESLK
jgi:glycerol-3-phosphate cytidylyltransferase